MVATRRTRAPSATRTKSPAKSPERSVAAKPKSAAKAAAKATVKTPVSDAGNLVSAISSSAKPALTARKNSPANQITPPSTHRSPKTESTPRPTTTRAGSTPGVHSARRTLQLEQSTFQHLLWWLLALENWILDWGRPLAMDLSKDWSWFPLALPSLGDYFHMIYNVATPLILLALMARSPKPLSPVLQSLLVSVFVMGASIHLVADSVNHRLRHVGYQNDLTVAENPIMKVIAGAKTTDPKLKPENIVLLFELLYFYDERFGHLMWYIPFFGALVFYFIGCETDDEELRNEKVPATALYGLLPLSSLYFWYLSTEGQITPLFLLTALVMAGVALFNRTKGKGLDVNGRFLIYTMFLSLAFVLLWSLFLWNDAHLRARYPGFFYVPEPWTYKGLYGNIIPGVW